MPSQTRKREERLNLVRRNLVNAFAERRAPESWRRVLEALAGASQSEPPQTKSASRARPQRRALSFRG
jgi:hypothetical protein